jgi:hypothetical protein
MKIKNVCVYLLFLLFYQNLLIQAQGILQSADRQPYANTVRYYYETGCYNSISNYQKFSTSVGFDYMEICDSEKKCTRSISQTYNRAYKFYFSLPSNAILTSVLLTVGCSYNTEIVALPVDVFTYSAGDMFGAINSGDNLFDAPVTGNQDITSYASQFLSDGAFCIGARSSSVSHEVTISCLLNYQIPATISFENNMGGQISVNGTNHTGSYSNDYWLSSNISLFINEP